LTSASNIKVSLGQGEKERVILKIQNSKFKIQNSKFKSQKPKAKSQKPKAKSQKPKTIIGLQFI